MPRKPTCTCGTCYLCKNREYKRIHAAKKRESAVQYPIKEVCYICADDTETSDELKAYQIQIEFYIANPNLMVEHPERSSVWRCSDGVISSDEVSALRHELGLFKRG